MSKLTIDYNFSAKDNITSGISQERLEQLKEVARGGFAKLTELSKNGEVGFMSLPEQDLAEIKELAKENNKKFNDLVIIGVGGSILGLEAIANAILPSGFNKLSYNDRKGIPRFWIIDNSDPALISSVFKYCSAGDTYTVIVSKSGSTAETLANSSLTKEWYEKAKADLAKHIAVVTGEQDNPLRRFANSSNIKIIDLKSNTIGRYSVLSPAGLYPAALLGIDIDRLLQGAAEVDESWSKFLTMSAIYLHFIESGRNINVFMPYSSKLNKFAEWLRQLWGESLGKKIVNEDGSVTNFGTTPISAIGAIDQHSALQLYLDGPDDKFITFFGFDKHFGDQAMNAVLDDEIAYFKGKKLGELLNTELSATEAVLALNNRPSMRLNYAQIDEHTVGNMFMIYQQVVSIIALAKGVNPFDQPAVELGKKFALGLLGKVGNEKYKEEFSNLYNKKPQFIVE